MVNQLRVRAVEEFKQQEQVLLSRIEVVETSLAPATDGQKGMVLNEAQTAEVAVFEKQHWETRKQLWQVQHQLNRSIDELERRLKWLNILLVPLLLLMTMVVLLLSRHHGGR